MAKTIIIHEKERLRGEDGTQIVSVRIKKELLEKLDLLAAETNHSRNALITMFIRFCVDNHEVVKVEDAEG